MRVKSLAAAASTLAVLGVLAGPAAPAVAATPAPWTCTAGLQAGAVPANPGNLVATAAVAVTTAEVVCTKDVLTTPPIEYASLWGGDISLGIHVGHAGGPRVCSAPLGIFTTAGPTLVMHNELACVVGVDVAGRENLVARLDWATNPPYMCCGQRIAPINIVGLA